MLYRSQGQSPSGVPKTFLKGTAREVFGPGLRHSQKLLEQISQGLIALPKFAERGLTLNALKH